MTTSFMYTVKKIYFFFLKLLGSILNVVQSLGAVVQLAILVIVVNAWEKKIITGS